MTAKALALSLAKRGGFVFPVNSKKKPLTAKDQYSEHRWSATNDVATVQHVFDRFPKARVGLACGESKYVVVDIDPGAEGWYRRNQERLECGFRIGTPRGGQHLYYLADEHREVRDSTSLVSKNVDVRGEGGYVVVYDEVLEGTANDIGAMPKWLIEECTRKQRANGHDGGHKISVDFSVLTPHHGERSAKLISYCGRIIQEHPAWSWKRIVRAVEREADKCKPPFGSLAGEERELERTVLVSGRKYYEARQAEVERARDSHADVVTGSLIVTAQELWVPKKLGPMLVEGLLEHGAEAALHGASQTGKSLWLLELGLSIAAGRAFFEHRVAAGPVLYFCGEGAGAFGRRFQALCLARNVEPDSLPFAIVPRPLALTEGEGFAVAQDALNEFRDKYGEPHAIFIDTFSRYAAGVDEDKAGDLYRFFNALKELRHDNTATVTAHHTGHSDGARARGSSAWGQGADTEFIATVAGEPDSLDSVRTFTNRKQKDEEPAAPMHFTLVRKLTRTRREGTLAWSVILEPADAPKPEINVKGLSINQRMAMSVVVEMKSDRATCANELASRTGVLSRNAHRIIRELEKRGLIGDKDGVLYSVESA